MVDLLGGPVSNHHPERRQPVWGEIYNELLYRMFFVNDRYFEIEEDILQNVKEENEEDILEYKQQKRAERLENMEEERKSLKYQSQIRYFEQIKHLEGILDNDALFKQGARAARVSELVLLFIYFRIILRR